MSSQILNAETMMSIEEAIDDFKEHRLLGATSLKELEALLNAD